MFLSTFLIPHSTEGWTCDSPKCKRADQVPHPDRTHTHTHTRRMRSVCNHHSKILQQHRIITRSHKNIRLMRSMWETTFARNTQAGFCKDFTTLSYTMGYVRFVNLLTKSGLGISRKCCFPHGMRSVCNHHSTILQPHRSITRSHTHTHLRSMRSVCNHHFHCHCLPV